MFYPQIEGLRPVASGNVGVELTETFLDREVIGVQQPEDDSHANPGQQEKRQVLVESQRDQRGYNRQIEVFHRRRITRHPSNDRLDHVKVTQPRLQLFVVGSRGGDLVHFLSSAVRPLRPPGI